MSFHECGLLGLVSWVKVGERGENFLLRCVGVGGSHFHLSFLASNGVRTSSFLS